MAPTDSMLATDVQLCHPGYKDYLQFNLTCEAGMNDGSTLQYVLNQALAEQVTQFVLVVVALSIIVHGTSVKPIMEKFWR